MNKQDYDPGTNWPDRYYPADRIPYDPADEEIRNMLKIVAYDICDAKRLRKVAKTCELYGIRIEKSVFECDLTQELFEQFWLELMEIIDKEDDSIVAYPIGKADAREILSMGCISRPQKRLCYVCGCC